MEQPATRKRPALILNLPANIDRRLRVQARRRQGERPALTMTQISVRALDAELKRMEAAAARSVVRT